MSSILCSTLLLNLEWNLGLAFQEGDCILNIDQVVCNVIIASQPENNEIFKRKYFLPTNLDCLLKTPITIFISLYQHVSVFLSTNKVYQKQKLFFNKLQNWIA